MTENINGIQVDVSKYVGEEIAKLAVATIEQERLEALAKQAVNNAFNGEEWYDGRRSTPVYRMVTKIFSEKLQEQIDAIAETEEFKATARKKAEEILEEMQDKVKEIAINKYAEALSGNFMHGYYDGCFRMNVQDIVMDMMSSR